jgi:type I restriction enzyme S subunit
VIGGGTPPKDKEHYFKGIIPWATVRDMRKDIISDTEFRITQEAVEACSTNIIPAHNVIIATRVGLGKVCFVERDTAINQDLRGIVPIRKNELSVHYLFWWLKSIAHLIVQEGTGATVQGVKLPFIKSLEIPLPPLPEQKRIVAILDEAFAGIAAATANAEKNLANARELFTSYVSAIFSSQEGGWTELPLGEVCENLDSRRIPITKSDRTEGDVPYYGASGIVDYVAEHIFDEDILLISEDGANLLARTYPIAFSVSGKCWVNNHAHVVRFTSMATQRIVEFYLNSISLAPYVSGMAQPKLNQKAMNSIIVPLPPQEDHARIVRQIEMIQEESKRLQDNYNQKLAALNELKQTILQKAFSGELTAQPGAEMQEEAA